MATSKQAVKLLQVFEDLETEPMQSILGSGILSDIAKCPNPSVVDRDSLKKVLMGLRVEFKGFPIWKTLKIGGVSKEELFKKLAEGGHRTSDYARDIMGKPAFTTANKPTTLKLVRVTVKELGFTERPITTELYARAKKHDLELCPAEVGPHLRIVYRDQPMNERNWIAMETITDSDGGPILFTMEQRSGGSWLSTDWANPVNRWGLGDRIVFVSRK